MGVTSFLKSNKPYQRIKGFYGDVANAYFRKEGTPWQTPFLKSDMRKQVTYGKTGKAKKATVGEGFKPTLDDVHWGRVSAGGLTAYAGADATYRALSGGSLYRNEDGESDLVGIPIF